MVKRIMYTRPDGGVSFVTPVSDEYLEKARTKSVPQNATNIEIIEEIDVPVDREFRNAWKQNGRKIEIDLGKAKELVLAQVPVNKHAAVNAATTIEELKVIRNS